MKRRRGSTAVAGHVASPWFASVTAMRLSRNDGTTSGGRTSTAPRAVPTSATGLPAAVVSAAKSPAHASRRAAVTS